MSHAGHIDTVLFLDDEQNILHALQRIFVREPVTCYFMQDGRDALAFLKDQPIDVVVSDLKMPEMDGMTFLQKVKELYPETLRVILTGYTQIPQMLDAINKGEIYRYLTKPLDEPELLLSTIRQAVEFQHLRRERRDLTSRLEKRNRELEKAMEEIRQLQGLLPICSYCKKIRTDQGCWQQIEAYVQEHSDATFTHGICPECRDLYFSDLAQADD